jgi:hypothetical protein
MFFSLVHRRRNPADSIDRPYGLFVRVAGTDPEVRFRFPALPDFLRSSGPGTESTQPRSYNYCHMIDY